MDQNIPKRVNPDGNVAPARPDPQPLQYPITTLSEDIYRGTNPRLSTTPAPIIFDNASVSSDSSSSSSASSASAHLVQRALATVVELAISHWARSSTDDSSSSSSTSTRATSPERSLRRRRSRRRPRRGSVSTVTIDHSQIARDREAIERARRVPRNFHLVLPEVPSRGRKAQQRTLQTSSLPAVLSQLELALKRSARARRDRHPRYRPTPPAPTISFGPSAVHHPSLSHTTPALVNGVQTEEENRRSRQKQPKHLVRPSIGTVGGRDGGFTTGQSAWWLDVASPTWEDMRAIGTVCNLFKGLE